MCFYNFKLYNIKSKDYFDDFSKKPDLYLNKNILKNIDIPRREKIDLVVKNSEKAFQDGHDVVELFKKSLQKGRKDLLVNYKSRTFSFVNEENLILFLSNPELYDSYKLPDKMPFNPASVKNLELGQMEDSSSYLENSLGDIIMKVLAQLGYKQLKYPTISPQETALKFLAISLKCHNKNQNEHYRNKYKKKLQKFLKNCDFRREIKSEYERKGDFFFFTLKNFLFF